MGCSVPVEMESCRSLAPILLPVLLHPSANIGAAHAAGALPAQGSGCDISPSMGLSQRGHMAAPPAPGSQSCPMPHIHPQIFPRAASIVALQSPPGVPWGRVTFVTFVTQGAGTIQPQLGTSTPRILLRSEAAALSLIFGEGLRRGGCS